MSASLPVLDLTAPGAPRYSKLIGRPIDNTALSAFMRCPSEYHKSMVLHRRTEGKNAALCYGGAWHVAMETHYKSSECSINDLIDQVVLEVTEKWEDPGDPDDYRTLGRLVIEYKKYLRQYGLPWQEDFKTIGWPENPFVEISGELAVPGARHPYAYKIDRAGKAQSQYLIEDHKTCSRFDKNYFRQFELDNQMMGYAAMAQLLTGQVIAGVRINCHVIHKNDSIFERRTVSFSQVRLDDWARNLDRWMKTDRRQQERTRCYADFDPTHGPSAFR
jgi:hypothetical protein